MINSEGKTCFTTVPCRSEVLHVYENWAFNTMLMFFSFGWRGYTFGFMNTFQGKIINKLIVKLKAHILTYILKTYFSLSECPIQSQCAFQWFWLQYLNYVHFRWAVLQWSFSYTDLNLAYLICVWLLVHIMQLNFSNDLLQSILTGHFSMVIRKVIHADTGPHNSRALAQLCPDVTNLLIG